MLTCRHHIQLGPGDSVSFPASLDLFICDTGVMAQWLEHLPHNQKAMGLRPVGVIPKTFKMVLTAFSSGT